MSLHPSYAFQTTPPAIRLQDLTADLNKSVEHAIRHRPCSRGVVMAFHWKNDDMGLEVLENQLLDIFRRVYHYEVSTYVIPLANSQIELIYALGHWFQKIQGDGVLRIVVYSGHARAAGTTTTEWMLG